MSLARTTSSPLRSCIFLCFFQQLPPYVLLQRLLIHLAPYIDQFYRTRRLDNMSLSIPGKSTLNLIGSSSTSRGSHDLACCSAQALSGPAECLNDGQQMLTRAVATTINDQNPLRLRKTTSIALLVKQVSLQALRLALNKNQSSYLHDTTINQPNDSFIHLPGSPGGPICRPPTPTTESSDLTSLESPVLDHSGISASSSEPPTPVSYETTQPTVRSCYEGPLSQVMGGGESKLSNVVRKPLPSRLQNKRSRQSIIRTGANILTAATTHDPTRIDQSTVNQAQSRSRASSGTISVQIPRRRSSLTALHLDASHFEGPDSKNDKKMRDSSFSESFKPILRDSSADTVIQTSQHRELMLSPPILSPTASRPSSAGSQMQSQRSTPIPSHIHLPQTFPDGPIEMPVPALTKWHYQCYQSHKYCLKSPNAWHPAPCMTCEVRDSGLRWKCTWCALRVCSECMRVLAAKGRSLMSLIEWVQMEGAKKEENVSKAVEHKGRPFVTPAQARTETPTTDRALISRMERPRPMRISKECRERIS